MRTCLFACSIIIILILTCYMPAHLVYMEVCENSSSPLGKEESIETKKIKPVILINFGVHIKTVFEA